MKIFINCIDAHGKNLVEIPSVGLVRVLAPEVFSSLLPVGAKRSNNFLHNLGFECPHHLMVSPPEPAFIE